MTSAERAFPAWRSPSIPVSSPIGRLPRKVGCCSVAARRRRRDVATSAVLPEACDGRCSMGTGEPAVRRSTATRW